MKAVVFAYHNIGCEGIDALVRNGIDIDFVVTHEDDPLENVWFDSVAERAAAHGIPAFAPKDPNHPLWVERVRRAEPDFVFSFYYRKLLKPELLAIPRLGALNLHGSLLPRYRGRCPVNWVLIHGESETGVTLHHMTRRPDAGDIVAQRSVPIEQDDTARSLLEKLTRETRLLLDDTLPRLQAGTVERTPQSRAAASYFGGRRPEDGRIDWSKSAREVRNLVRAVTRPYPGAFTSVGGTKCLIWAASEVPGSTAGEPPGTVLSVDPPVISCGGGALRIDSCQPAAGIYMSGSQMARELGLSPGMQVGHDALGDLAVERKREVLILGANGFIGNALGKRLLASGRYRVHGMDLRSDNVADLCEDENFDFAEGDIAIHREWIEYHVKKCDIVLPLVAIATPIEYTRNPLRVFELDFEENLRVIRYCVKYGKRLVFPSTSEVYGMCDEDVFDEDESKLVVGPIRMQRWIYSCSKQLLDRVVWAYGDKEGLDFTLFRPFNWIGPRLDRLTAARIGSSRAITQMILNLVEGSPILLIDGGGQRRCFTDVSEGVECLFRIIENRGGACNGRIFNIGNPNNECSIRELGELLLELFESHPLRGQFPRFAGFRVVESESYYGAGYQDLTHRKPSIRNARKHLDWNPTIDLKEAVEGTLDYFLRSSLAARRACLA